MAATYDKTIHAEASRREKIEITYRYVPLIGEILGYWRQVHAMKIGEEVVLNLNTPIQSYDRLIINGEEVPIPRNKN